jgi:hypothetical protein
MLCVMLCVMLPVILQGSLRLPSATVAATEDPPRGEAQHHWLLGVGLQHARVLTGVLRPQLHGTNDRDDLYRRQCLCHV